MTSTPSNSRPKLKVVAPQPTTPSPKSQPAPKSVPPSTPSDPSAEPSTPGVSRYRRWMLLGGIAMGLGLASLMPTSYQVGGEVILEWRENERQSVRSNMPAVVESILVDSGDQIVPGQTLAVLSSRELDKDIADIEEKLAKAHEELAEAQRTQVEAEARLIEAQAQEQAIRDRADRLQSRVNRVGQGNQPPEIQQLEVERQRLQGELQQAAINVDRYQDLYDQGAVALEDLEVRQNQYRNAQRDLDANAEQLRLAQQQLQDEAIDELGTAAYQQASVLAASMVASTTDQIAAHQDTIATLNAQLQALHAKQDDLVLQATTAGQVISDDLDLKVGQEIQPDTELMRIADLGQLTANIEVPEVDLDFVAEGAPVTFRARQAKLEPYNAQVEKILFDVQPDETQQRRVATVRLIIDNSDNRLYPGSSGYAKISSETMPLYQRLGREIVKIMPEWLL